MSAENEVVGGVVDEGRKWNVFDACMVAEGVEEVGSEEEYLEAWQYLVDTGVVWGLQGWYGRTAYALISSGQIRAAGKGKGA